MLQLIPLPYYAQEKSGVFAIDAHLKVNSDFELKLLNLERSQDGKLKIKKDSSPKVKKADRVFQKDRSSLSQSVKTV